MSKPTPAIVKGTEYKLPDGAILYCKKATNGVRRILLEQPETNLRFLMEIIACACLIRMDLPKNYNDNDEAISEEFLGEPKADVWKRFDKLTLVDQQAFMEAFQELNMPTGEMVKDLIKALKEGKA